MDDLDRRSALSFGLLTALAAPLVAISSPASADVPKYGPTDGQDIGNGRRVVPVGTRESQIDAYKSIKIIDVIYPVGAADPPDSPVMDMDMVCQIIAGEFRIQKTGIPAYIVKEGQMYTCGKGKSDSATNIGTVIGVHRIALLIPA